MQGPSPRSQAAAWGRQQPLCARLGCRRAGRRSQPRGAPGCALDAPFKPLPVFPRQAGGGSFETPSVPKTLVFARLPFPFPIEAELVLRWMINEGAAFPCAHVIICSPDFSSARGKREVLLPRWEPLNEGGRPRGAEIPSREMPLAGSLSSPQWPGHPVPGALVSRNCPGC